MPYMNYTNNNINSIFKYSLKEFLKENDIYPQYKFDNDKVHLIPYKNNIIEYNEIINNNNAFIIDYYFKLGSLYEKYYEKSKKNKFNVLICLFLCLYSLIKLTYETIGNFIFMESIAYSFIEPLINKKYRELYRIIIQFKSYRVYAFFIL